MKYYRKIDGIIPGMKNNKMLVKIHGRVIPITKPETQKRMEEIIQSLFCGGEFRNPVSVTINIHLKSEARRDLDNMCSTIMDCLVKAGVIQDDSIKFVKHIGISYFESDIDYAEIIVNDD